ncbi:hypothetical protein FH972_000842 [Carpinus fangiana]|uniref:Uncharacterized protein n=1 Tax=Carpinus fangiana TaxID=176857 RepID=A0A5N6QCK5_9ROSI|nr:hypothetical protein FH972_000842 [Carpinus fangiana]
MFGRRGHRLYFLNVERGRSRWLWIVLSLTIMITRRRRRVADPTKVAGDLPRAANPPEDRALKSTLDPVEIAGDLPTEFDAGDLPAEVVTVIRYHLPALSSSDWNHFFISFADDVKELFLKNGSSRWHWIVRPLTIMIRRRRRVADLAEDPLLEPVLDLAKVVGDLQRAADATEDRALEPALDPVEVAGNLPAKVVAANRYHPPALRSSDVNSFSFHLLTMSRNCF